MSLCPSVCPHETTRLPLDGFAWDLIFEDSSKICRKISTSIKIWRKCTIMIPRWFLLRMRNILDRSWAYTHFVFTNFFVRKSCRLWGNLEEFRITRQATETIQAAQKWCVLHVGCLGKNTDTFQFWVLLLPRVRNILVVQRELIFAFPWLCWIFLYFPQLIYIKNNKKGRDCVSVGKMATRPRHFRTLSVFCSLPYSLTPSFSA